MRSKSRSSASAFSPCVLQNHPAERAAFWAYIEAACTCMTEPDEHGEERVVIHSMTCRDHPEFDPSKESD